MKNSTSQLTQEQREMFTRLLEQAKARAESDLEGDELRERMQAEIAPKLAEERGANVVLEKLQKLQSEVEGTENSLRQLGFECRYEGELSIIRKCPKELKQAMDAAVKAAMRERDEKLKQFDRAILSVWTAEDVSEAKAIVEGLI